MAVKKKAAKRKTVKKQARKISPSRRVKKKVAAGNRSKGARKKTVEAPAYAPAPAKIGDHYECMTCGLVVQVAEHCGCIRACDILCCGFQMRPIAWVGV